MYQVMGWPGPVTHRQFSAWTDWDQRQMGVPDRSDYYAMGIAAEVRRVLNDKPKEVKLEHFRIKFGPKGPKLTKKQAALIADQVWRMRLGIGPDST